MGYFWIIVEELVILIGCFFLGAAVMILMLGISLAVENFQKKVGKCKGSHKNDNFYAGALFGAGIAFYIAQLLEKLI